MKNPRLILIVFATILFWSSCKKETVEPVEMGYKYFPVNIGHWAIYDVDSISYNDFTGLIDSFKYQIKEIVESDFIDNQGRTSQRLERYIRLSDTSAWTIKDVWFETLTASTAERVEENLRMIKLVFPISDSFEWNGNNYNIIGEQKYSYQDVFTPALINNISMDSTVTVMQKNSQTLISEDYQKEIYAVHVGMVYKKYVALEKQPTGTITSGIDYSYTLRSYGN